MMALNPTKLTRAGLAALLAFGSMAAAQDTADDPPL